MNSILMPLIPIGFWTSDRLHFNYSNNCPQLSKVGGRLFVFFKYTNEWMNIFCNDEK
jgi:hypothetical protein